MLIYEKRTEHQGYYTLVNLSNQHLNSEHVISTEPL